MANQPDIFCIHESDADMHLGQLKQISEKFIAQNRVGEFVALLPEEAISSLPQKVKEKDLIILLLTDGLANKRTAIRELLVGLKSKSSDLIIAEIIIDQIQYDQDYISWPSDLTPIRNREDMDAAWLGIESSLDGIIPKRRTISWKKYLKPIAAVVAAALLIWLLPRLFSNGSDPQFSLKIMDGRSGKIHDTTECYLPCIALVSTNLRKYDSLMWDFGDTTITMEKELSYLFLIPGQHKITLTTMDGNRKKNATRELLVKAPLVADFDANNDGCKAPCEIAFVNKSGEGTFNWTFDGINQTSTEENPKMQYTAPGTYNVTLTVTNKDKVGADTLKKVTIREDDSPFAEFSTARVGPGPASRVVKFENLSKNADEFIWTFGDGTPPVTEREPTHTYQNVGTYKVDLIAKRGNEAKAQTKHIRVGIWWHVVNPNVKATIAENPQLRLQVERLQERNIQNP